MIPPGCCCGWRTSLAPRLIPEGHHTVESVAWGGHSWWSRTVSCPLNSSGSTSDTQCRPPMSLQRHWNNTWWSMVSKAKDTSSITWPAGCHSALWWELSPRCGAACMPTGRVPQGRIYARVQVLRQPGGHHRLQQIGHKRQVVDWSVVQYPWQLSYDKKTKEL